MTPPFLEYMNDKALLWCVPYPNISFLSLNINWVESHFQLLRTYTYMYTFTSRMTLMIMMTHQIWFLYLITQSILQKLLFYENVSRIYNQFSVHFLPVYLFNINPMYALMNSSPQ